MEDLFIFITFFWIKFQNNILLKIHSLIDHVLSDCFNDGSFKFCEFTSQLHTGFCEVDCGLIRLRLQKGWFASFQQELWYNEIIEFLTLLPIEAFIRYINMWKLHCNSYIKG